MSTPPHTLIITETTEDGVTDREYSIECPGVTDDCRLWEECRQSGCDLDDLLDNDDVAHGVQHRYVVDFYGVPLDSCAVNGDGLPEAAEALNLPAGRYPVTFTFDPDFGGVDELTVLTEVSA